jgi:hypothetical protein
MKPAFSNYQIAVLPLNSNVFGTTDIPGKKRPANRMAAKTYTIWCIALCWSYRFCSVYDEWPARNKSMERIILDYTVICCGKLCSQKLFARA